MANSQEARMIKTLQVLLGAAVVFITGVGAWNVNQNIWISTKAKDIEQNVQSISNIITELRACKQDVNAARIANDIILEKIQRLEIKTTISEMEIPKLRESIDRLSTKVEELGKVKS